MSRKLKVTAVAILATLTFATTAFAGFFEVLGGIVAGTNIISNQYQQQGQKAGNSYLDKMAKSIHETGDADAAFNDVVKQYQDGKYDVQVTEADGGKVKTMTAAKSDMVVRAIWTLNKNTQTISVKHESTTDGSQIGDILSKKYELSGGNSVASTSSNQASSVTQTQGSCVSGISSSEMNAKFSIMPNNSLSKNDIVEYVCPNGQTGCPAFDASPLKGNVEFIKAAYLTAKIPQDDGYTHRHTDSSVEGMCDEYAANKNDPFIAPQIKNASKQLVAYYRAGGQLDYRLYYNVDYLTNNPLSIDTSTGDSRLANTYKLAKEIYILSWPLYVYMCYDFKIPSSQMGSVFKQLQNIAASNEAAIKRVKENAYKKNFQKQKITVIRFSKGFDTPIDEYQVYNEELPLMRNAYLSIRLLDGFVTYKNYELRYEFPSTRWKEVLGYTAVDVVRKKK